MYADVLVQWRTEPGTTKDPTADTTEMILTIIPGSVVWEQPMKTEFGSIDLI